MYTSKGGSRNGEGEGYIISQHRCAVSRSHINIGHVLKPPHARDSQNFTNSEKLHPHSGYGYRETPNLWSAPFTISESSNSLLTPLTLFICYIRKLHSHNHRILRMHSTISRLLDCVEHISLQKCLVKTNKEWLVQFQ